MDKLPPAGDLHHLQSTSQIISHMTWANLNTRSR